MAPTRDKNPVDVARSHISGLQSWPPNDEVGLHLSHFARKIAAEVAEGTLLDVGCGDGSLARTLAEASPNLDVVGMDLAESTPWSWSKPDNLKFVVGEVDRFPFRPGSFDYVLIKDVLHHVPDPRGTFQRVSKLARRKIIVIEANRYNPISYVWMVKIAKHEHFSRQRLRAIVGSDAPFVSMETHVWPPSLRRAGRLVEKIVNAWSALQKLANYNCVVVGVDRKSGPGPTVPS